MIINEEMAELICSLEHRIGSNTYNPNSYNGWTDEEGCSYKYPVRYYANEFDFYSNKRTKTKSRIEYIHPDYVETMKYILGTNHLYIGKGIISALELIKKRYNISFNDLEENELIQEYLK